MRPSSLFLGCLGLLALCLLVLNVVGLAVGLASQGTATDSQSESACRARIASAYNELRDERDALTSELVQINSRTLRNGATPDPNNVARYLVVDGKLTHVREELLGLPPARVAYRDGVTVNGVVYEGC